MNILTINMDKVKQNKTGGLFCMRESFCVWVQPTLHCNVSHWRSPHPDLCMYLASYPSNCKQPHLATESVLLFYLFMYQIMFVNFLIEADHFQFNPLLTQVIFFSVYHCLYAIWSVLLAFYLSCDIVYSVSLLWIWYSPVQMSDGFCAGLLCNTLQPDATYQWVSARKT